MLSKDRAVTPMQIESRYLSVAASVAAAWNTGSASVSLAGNGEVTDNNSTNSKE